MLRSSGGVRWPVLVGGCRQHSLAQPSPRHMTICCEACRTCIGVRQRRVAITLMLAAHAVPYTSVEAAKLQPLPWCA